MKLYALAEKLEQLDLNVRLIDNRTQRISFEGSVEKLMSYSGIDHRSVVNIRVGKNTLCIDVR